MATRHEVSEIVRIVKLIVNLSVICIKNAYRFINILQLLNKTSISGEEFSNYGSPFVHQLSEHLQESAHDTDIDHILMKVNI